MMGEISTPPTGEINFLVGIKNISVGKAMRMNGKRLKSTWGYQVRTIRKINKNIINPSKMLRVRFVAASVVMAECLFGSN
jgi:hypothetical protein